MHIAKHMQRFWMYKVINKLRSQGNFGSQTNKKQYCYNCCILNAFSVHGDLHTFTSDLHNLVRKLFCFIFTIGRYPSSERTHNLLITIYVYLVAEADSKVSLTPSWFQSLCPLHELPLETLILLLIMSPFGSDPTGNT